MTATFFNLLVNSFFSLLAGTLAVYLFIWLFRIETGPWKLALISFPFLKIVYDALRGLPEGSVLLSQVDPFSLPPRHQLLQIGADLSYFGPSLSTSFSVQDVSGRVYASSAGDYLTIWLKRTFGLGLPNAILCVAALVAGTLLLRRLYLAFRFERERRRDRETSVLLREQKLGWLLVDIYVSQKFSGSPFTGGVLLPYICIPEEAFASLSKDELEAVIAHELGHIRQLDLPITFFIQFLGDCFWFVPGYRWLSGRMDRLREIVADQWAVRAGTDPRLLASALVKLRETSQCFAVAPYSAFFRERSLLKTRVERLLGVQTERPSRWGWQFMWVRIPVTVWIFTAVMLGTFGGNHSTLSLPGPDWLPDIVKVHKATGAQLKVKSR